MSREGSWKRTVPVTNTRVGGIRARIADAALLVQAALADLGLVTCWYDTWNNRLCRACTEDVRPSGERLRMGRIEPGTQSCDYCNEVIK